MSNDKIIIIDGKEYREKDNSIQFNGRLIDQPLSKAEKITFYLIFVIFLSFLYFIFFMI